MLSNYVICGWPSTKSESEKKQSHTGHSEMRLCSYRQDDKEWQKNNDTAIPAGKGTGSATC